MSDEPLVPVDGDEAQIDAPEEEQAPPPKTIEDVAREHNWKPRDEFLAAGGDEAQWRDAEAFVSYGIKRNRDMSNDLRDLRAQTERLVRTTGQITQQTVERARAEERQQWEAKHRRAVEEGDLSGATTAVQKIAELQNPAPSQPQQDPEVERFVRDNAWFTSDRFAHTVAQTAAGEVAERGGTVAEQLKAAREAVHKRFPEYAPQQAKQPASVAPPAGRVAPTRSTAKKGVADLSSTERQVAEDLKRRGFIKSVEDYAEQAFGNGEFA